jgi:hypothetical protein
MVKFSYKLVKTDKIVRKDENKHKIIELIPHNDITKEELEGYISSLETIGRAPTTISRNIASMKAFFGYLYQEGYKGLNTDLIEESIKYSLTREDLKDPLMILNIINLIKIYNNLNDNFFQDENIYIDSKKQLLDIKKHIKQELKDFIKKLSIYFISIIKSYNKVTYTSLDTYTVLPNIYKTIFLSSDFLTLAGILSVSDSFNTEECVTVKDSFTYVSSLLTKNLLSINLMNNFFKDFDEKIKKDKNDNSNQSSNCLSRFNKFCFNKS